MKSVLSVIIFFGASAFASSQPSSYLASNNDPELNRSFVSADCPHLKPAKLQNSYAKNWSASESTSDSKKKKGTQ